MTSKQSLFAFTRLRTIFVAMLIASCSLAVAQTEFLAYSFPLTHGNPLHGCIPQGSLVADSAGNLYGTAAACGTLNNGLVYELIRPIPPKKGWVQRVIYNFTGGDDGGGPEGTLTIDATGNLYGTAAGGAARSGVVFELSPPAAEGDAWTETVIHEFQGGPADGASPATAGVVFDQAGNLYGVTRYGGIANYPACDPGCGVIYQLKPPNTAGAAWTETVLHYFDGMHGGYGTGTPVFDGKGSLYGLAGVLYRLVPPATEDGAWIYKDLLTPSAAGASPGGLIFHNNGRLYGIGAAGKFYSGDVFELVPPTAGGAWTLNIIHSFAGGGDGIAPDALGNVIFDKAGNLYGTTQYGGVGGCQHDFAGCGTVFELSPPAKSGGAWKEAILHSFEGSATDGDEPTGGLILAKNGVLFGVTWSGGTGSSGTVYGVVP